MCGFIVDFRPFDRAKSWDLGALRHRGPDDAQEWLSPSGRLWFGHVRLAILELSPQGAQPMRDEETGTVIVFNGEIYNHLDLRAEIEKERPGIRWRGGCDTETLLAGLALWGRDFVPRLRGMFAFVWYDPRAETLLAARDALGIKPLYYVSRPEGISFASEIRPLVSRFGVPPTRAEVSAYLQWGACPESALLFSAADALPAGSTMECSPDAAGRISHYWPRPGKRGARLEAAGESPVREVRRLLERAVREHLLSDVPLASFLSSGFDSSILTALAARYSPEPLRTFTLGFEDPALDESEAAAAFAAHCGARHHAIRLSNAEALVAVQEAVEKMDLPSVDAINTYIVCQAARRLDLKVALSGLGADEIFGGYPSFADVPWLRWIARVPEPIRRGVASCLDGGGPWGRFADLVSGSTLDVTRFRRRFWTDRMLRDAGLPTRDFLSRETASFGSEFSDISWAEITGYTRNMLLRDSDQMSMAVSLELRVPYLDHELVGYVLGLPEEEKTRYRQTKGLLVEACRDLLPPSFLTIRKRGFSLPMRQWMGGPLRDFTRRGLDAATAEQVLPESYVRRLEEEFASGRLHWTRLWSVVVLGHYLAKNRPGRTA